MRLVKDKISFDCKALIVLHQSTSYSTNFKRRANLDVLLRHPNEVTLTSFCVSNWNNVIRNFSFFKTMTFSCAWTNSKSNEWFSSLVNLSKFWLLYLPTMNFKIEGRKFSFQKHTALNWFFFQSRKRDDCFLKKYMEEKKYTEKEVRYVLSMY